MAITCDGVKTNANDWGGLSIGMTSRQKATGNVFTSAGNTFSFKESTISFRSMTSSPSNSSFGVYLANNTATVKFQRKAHVTSCPKVMAGTYTVKVYGLDSL